MWSKNVLHPLFEHEHYISQVIKRGKTNLDHDIFDEANSIIILDYLRQVLFTDNKQVCYCNHDINCFLLQPVHFFFNYYIYY